MRINMLVRTAVAGVCTAALVTPALTSSATGQPVEHARAATQTIKAKVTKHGVTLRGVHDLHAGRARLVVTGKGDVSVSFAAFKAGYTTQDFMRDARLGFGKNDSQAIRRIYANADALGGLGPGGSGTIVFPHPGRYYAIGGGEKVSTPVPISVGPRRSSRTPHVDGKIVATDGPAWRGSSQLPAKGTLLFKNAATTPVLHFVVMQRVAEGTTVDMVLDLLQSDEGPDPDWVLSGSMDTDVLSQHRAMTVDYDLPAGQYAVLCFMPDPSMHGMPHAAMGMIEMIHLG